MFNIYSFEKKLHQVKQLDTVKTKYLEDLSRKKVLNDRYAQGYKKRIENFVINMIENPIVVNSYNGS